MEAGKDWWCGGGTSQALRVMTDQLMVGTLISFDPAEDIYHVRLQVECGAEREDDAMKAVQGLMAIMTEGRKHMVRALPEASKDMDFNTDGELVRVYARFSVEK